MTEKFDIVYRYKDSPGLLQDGPVGVSIRRAPLQYGLLVRPDDIGKYVEAAKFDDEDDWRFLDGLGETYWRKGKDGQQWLHEAFSVKEVIKPSRRSESITIGFKIVEDDKNPKQLLLIPQELPQSKTRKPGPSGWTTTF